MTIPIYLTMSFALTSTAFGAGHDIPAMYTCDGKNISPPLSWSGLPQGTQSLALIVDDPDAPEPAAPRRVWAHWVLYNIPISSKTLLEDAHTQGLPPGTCRGLNDWKNAEYGGPCPPVGQHRYFHKLFALDVALPDLGHITKAQLEQAMQGHVLAQAELIGLYQRR